MQVEQALYGEHRGGHSLLASSGDDEASTGIVQRLDLPDTAPPGVEWSPFLRGFPYRDRYVLARTFHDTGASRGGMVFSHAILVPLDEIVETLDLGPLVRLLATSYRQRPEVVKVELVLTDTRLPRANDLMGAAEALGEDGRLPVVRTGHAGFDDLVIALWAHLLPDIRRDFAFRLSFDPRDLVETPVPALVCTPRAMAARWSDYPVIRADTSREPNSLAAALLSGHEKATPFRTFMRDIGAKPETFQDLRLLEQAHLFATGESTLERCVRAARLTDKLSPDTDAGKQGKDVLVRHLCELLPAASADQTQLLRNLQLSAFPSPNRVWKALETWVAENSYPRDEDAQVLSVLDDATTSTAAVEEWQTAVLRGLTFAAASRKSYFPKAFWRWFKIRPETVVAVFRHVPDESGVEDRLTAATPRNLDETAADTLVKPVLSRGWLRMHGAILSAAFDPLDAARGQIAVDTDPSFIEGLRSALRHVNAAELVECAVEIEDPRVSRLAGEAAAKNPGLLTRIDLTAMTGQAVWREALAIDHESWRGPADPAAAFHTLLDCLLDGEEADRTLIDRLSYTPVADLGSYPRRPELWSRIGDVALGNLLAETAKGWLRRAADGRVSSAPEHDLQSAIFENDAFEPTLDALIPKRISTAIRIVNALDRYDEQQFLRFIGRMMLRTTSLEFTDAEGIGHLVLERRWKDAAADLVARYESGRRDLKPTLRACYDMLHIWIRISLGLVPVPKAAKWRAFEEVAAELYPAGPDDEGLWERAGGNDADLSSSGNGRIRWRKALWKVRKGKGPTLSVLLTTMREDFPNNERLPHLAEDRMFGGGVSDEPRSQ